MKHVWKSVRKPQGVFLGPDQRKCVNCGLVQEKKTDSSAMQTVVMKWLPLAGRCKGMVKK